MLETGGSLSLSEAQSSFTQKARALIGWRSKVLPVLNSSHWSTPQHEGQGVGSPSHMRSNPSPLDMRSTMPHVRAADRAVSPLRGIVGDSAAIIHREPSRLTPETGMESGGGGCSDPIQTQSTCGESLDWIGTSPQQNSLFTSGGKIQTPG